VENWDGPTGMIDADLIKMIVADIDGSTFYICGPREMHDFCLPELQKLNIPRRRIRREVVACPADITGDPAWPAGIGSNTVFKIRYGNRLIPAAAGESILTTFERSGIAQENCCRAGECSLCRVKLLSGKVFQASTALVRQSDRKAGYIHSCVSYPISDLEIME
jgi:ferredoxin